MKVGVDTEDSHGFPKEALDDVTIILVLFEGVSKVPMKASKVGWDSTALTSGLPLQLRA